MYRDSNIETIEELASKLSVELDELKNLKSDAPEIKEAISTKEKMLNELKKFLARKEEDPE
jgi:hypothetical protein